MIKKIECYIAICDICNRNVDQDGDYTPHFGNEREALYNAVEEAECHEIDGKLCCPRCWIYDDDGEAVLRQEIEALGEEK